MEWRPATKGSQAASRGRCRGAHGWEKTTDSESSLSARLEESSLSARLEEYDIGGVVEGREGLGVCGLPEVGDGQRPSWAGARLLPEVEDGRKPACCMHDAGMEPRPGWATTPSPNLSSHGHLPSSSILLPFLQIKPQTLDFFLCAAPLLLSDSPQKSERDFGRKSSVSSDKTAKKSCRRSPSLPLLFAAARCAERGDGAAVVPSSSSLNRSRSCSRTLPPPRRTWSAAVYANDLRLAPPSSPSSPTSPSTCSSLCHQRRSSRRSWSSFPVSFKGPSPSLQSSTGPAASRLNLHEDAGTEEYGEEYDYYPEEDRAGFSSSDLTGCLQGAHLRPLHLHLWKLGKLC
ncbi:uncharacterized protein LOC124690736 [Lolium rigidum]|uniref:uncharacterized protein LOC124690736 n=1 Tax=Lolium rigidum TaxID=89674 RepID=UPI001F5DA774|nr:uncharacterized protein LOC124690736 [Lolium rigidum]